MIDWLIQQKEWVFSGIGIAVISFFIWLSKRAWRGAIWLYQRGLKRNLFYVDFEKVPWKDLFDKAQTLDICVHYFNTWIQNNDEHIVNFFNRGGTLNIILPNPDNEQLILSIAPRFPDLEVGHLKANVRKTETDLNILLKRSTSRQSQVKAYYVDEMIWYCGLRFGNTLVLSPYEQLRQVRVAAPAMVAPLDRNEKLNNWFNKEYEYLKTKAKS